MRYYSNTAVATTLENAGGVTPTSTQLILANTTGYPTQYPFTLRLDPDTPNEEIVTVTSGSGSAGTPYVVTRGADGTTARSHAQYSPVTHGFSARDLREPQEHIADSWAHVRRPLYSRQNTTPTMTAKVTWTNFTSAQWAAITFTAPPSGLVKVTISARLQHSEGGAIAAGVRVAGGATVAPDDSYALLIQGANTMVASRDLIFSGLTPGASTTITPVWWNSGYTAIGSLDITDGLLIVELLP